MSYYDESYAPYNQSNPYEEYETDIIKCVNNEMKTADEHFCDWLNDNEFLPPTFPSKEMESKMIDVLAKDQDVFYKYYEYRKEDVLELVQSQYDNFYE